MGNFLPHVVCPSLFKLGQHRQKHLQLWTPLCFVRSWVLITLFFRATPRKLSRLLLQRDCINSYGQFIECIQREPRGLENTRFMCAIRHGNNAAHLLAKLDTTPITVSTWLRDVPPSICDIIRREQSLFFCVIFDGSFEIMNIHNIPSNIKRLCFDFQWLC